MKKNNIILLMGLFCVSCSEKINERVVDKYENGNIKTIIKYTGEGSKENIVERVSYTEFGDTLKWEIMKEKFVLSNTYIDSLLVKSETYKEGLPVGNWIEYYDNGQLHYSYKYAPNGEKIYDGEQITFFKNGNPKSKKHYLAQIIDYNKLKITSEYPTKTYDGINEHKKIENIPIRIEEYFENGKLKKFEEYYLTDRVQPKKMGGVKMKIIKGNPKTSRLVKEIQYYESGDIKFSKVIEYKSDDDYLTYMAPKIQTEKNFVGPNESDYKRQQYPVGTMWKKWESIDDPITGGSLVIRSYFDKLTGNPKSIEHSFMNDKSKNYTIEYEYDKNSGNLSKEYRWPSDSTPNHLKSSRKLIKDYSK